MLISLVTVTHGAQSRSFKLVDYAGRKMFENNWSELWIGTNMRFSRAKRTLIA